MSLQHPTHRPPDALSATVADGGEAPPVADHAVTLPGGGWTVWRQFVLRGAGFPVTLVDRLSADGAAAAADRHVNAVRDVQRCREAALAEVNREFESADAAARRTLWERRRRISKGSVTVGARGECEKALARALTIEQAAAADFHDAFARETAAEADVITRIAADPRFREASLWQNHRAVGRVAHSLSTGGSGYRRAVDFVALQIQRYALKNESIGFFGPIGWGRVSDEPLTVAVRPGPSLLDRREVYFEGWSVDALVGRFNEDAALRPWSAPRLVTGVWTDATHVYAPVRGVVPTTPLQRHVLDLCDGWRTAIDIATAVTANARSGVSSHAQVFEILDELVRMELVVWQLALMPQLYPERELETRLAAIGDAALRERCASALGELVGARARVARAAGDADALPAALEELDATFARLTGRAPARRPGEMYAGRGLVYEECHRDCEVTIGRHLLERIGAPLSIVLEGARWAAAELAVAIRQEMRRRYAEVCGREGLTVVDGHFFLECLARAAPTTLGPLLREVRQRVQATWQSILSIDYGADRVTCDVEEVAGRARDAFHTDVPLWTRAQYISPDLLVAASSIEALRRGEFHCVLGEVHTNNSLLWSSFVSQHPNPQSLVDALRRDADGCTLVFNQVQKDIWLARTALQVYAPFAWRYECGDLPPRYACRSAPAAMFDAVDNGETIMMRARNGSLEFDAIDLIGAVLVVEASEIAKHWLPDVPHVPRITLGDLTITREGWLTRPGEMPFLSERDRAAQFAGARAWARERRMPRRVFYKSPVERKPCYLDFNSPTYVGIFVKFMRKLDAAAPVRVEEMLPDVGDAWLVDRDGARYTCELRLAATRDGMLGTRRQARTDAPRS